MSWPGGQSMGGSKDGKCDLHFKDGGHYSFKNPTMSISSNTFISSMLKEIGGITPYTAQDRYPTIDHIPSDIDALLLSSEPFLFKEKHKKELSERFLFPENKIHFIDGAHCSWHGANILHALPYLHTWRERL